MYSTIIRLNKQCKQCKQLDQIGPKRGDAMMPYAVPGPGCTSLFQNPSSNLSLISFFRGGCWNSDSEDLHDAFLSVCTIIMMILRP